MFVCYLCEKESVYTTFFCDSCREVKRIMNIYGSEECVNILRRVCIRDPQQREYKIDNELKHTPEPKARHKNVKGLDGEYEPPTTRKKAST
jgi:hypothetical protein